MTEHPDNRMSNAARKAIAVMLALSALAIFTPSATAIEVTGSCAASGDDGGFGGSKVSCTLACGSLAELLITATATDGGATVTGSYNCGGQGAPCRGTGPICEGHSSGLTNQQDEGIDACQAETDEWWSSPVTVACATLGGSGDNPPADPESVICEVYPSFPTCDDGGPQPVPDPVDRVRDYLDDVEIPDDVEVPGDVEIPEDFDVEGIVNGVKDRCKGEAVSHGITLSDEIWAGLFPESLAGLDVTSMLAFVTYPDGSILAFHVPPTELEESSKNIGVPPLPSACEIVQKTGPLFN